MRSELRAQTQTSQREPGDHGNKISPDVEQITVPRDDRLPLYVHTQGARIGLSKEMLKITPPSGHNAPAQQVGLGRISQLNLMGSIQLSTQAIRACLNNQIEIAYFSSRGWFYGRATGASDHQVHHRIAQFKAHQSCKALAISRALICDKIANSRTLLRRNLPAQPSAELSKQIQKLAQLKGRAQRADSPEQLLGIEGSAARIYWDAFNTLICQDHPELAMAGRTRRPPKDPVNAMLSFGYALLTKDCTHAVASAGLDPYLGVFHQSHHGSPALALDLIEPFRAIIVDSSVFQLIRRGQVSPDDFKRSEDDQGVRMRPQMRKKLLQAYERRMDTLITHPSLGLAISYRRTLAAQANLIRKVFSDELDTMPAFQTR